MHFFEYQNLWFAYIAALVVLCVCLYLVIRPLPFKWLKWNLLVAILVFFAAPIHITDQWMTPSAIYFLFEYFFLQHQEALEVLQQLLMHCAVAVAGTSCLLYGIHLFNKPSEND